MRTLYYVVGVALDDDDNIIGASVETETALDDPMEPVFDDATNEWRATRPGAEETIDGEVFAKIGVVLAQAFATGRTS